MTKLVRLISIGLVVVLVSLFTPAQRVSIEGIGTFSVGQEVAYASPDIAFVNETHGYGGGSATTIAASAASHTAGNLLVVIVVNHVSGYANVSSISDTAGNTYTYATKFERSDTSTIEIWYAKNISGNANNVVTATFSTSTYYREISVLQYSGADTSDPYDVSNTGYGSGTSQTTDASTTTYADEVIVAGYYEGDSGTFTAGTNFTVRYDGTYLGTEDRIVSSIGSYGSEITYSVSASYMAIHATFKAAAPEAGWLTDWCKRVKITIDHNDFDEDVTHFPVLIHLSDSCGIDNDDLTFVFDEVGANSKKIAVTEDDGTTQLYVEIEKWDETAEEAWLWVSKSDWTISSSEDTDIYLYYCNTQPDNDTYVGDSGSRTEVWDSNFQAVYHLSETAGGGSSGIEVDAVSSGIGDDSITISHTTSGENRLMLVGIYADVNDPFSIDSITYNDDDLELVGSEQLSWLHLWIYKLVAPDIGTYDMVVNFSTTTGPRAAAGVMTFTGVDQDTPLGAFASASGSGDTAEVTVSSAEGELVFDTVGDRNYQATVGAGQTERWNIEANQRFCAGSTEPGATSVDMTWTFTSTSWAIGAVPIKPAATSGAVKDSTSNANHGTDSGDPTFGATGEINSAVDFDGGDDYVDVGDIGIDLENDFSISAWMKFDTVSDERQAVGIGDSSTDGSLRFGHYSDGKFRVLFRENDNSNVVNIFNSGSELDDNNFHYCVFVFNISGNSYTAYVDGSSITSNSPSSYTSISSDKMVIGSKYVAGSISGYFNGLIDEVRISDSIRSAAWISATYETQIDDMLDFGSEETEEEEEGWLDDWCYRVKITIDHNDFDEDVTHFPVLIYLSTSSGREPDDVSFVFDEVGGNSKKIAVTEDDETTQLYVEIEKWDETAEEAWLWVSKSDWTISSSVDTVIYLYYCNTQPDNDTYVGDSGSRPEVWDSDFKGVWHLTEETGGTDAFKDSTSNANHGTDSGSPTLGSDGWVGNCVDFAGTSSEINVGSSDFGLDGSNYATFEHWLRKVNTNWHDKVLYRDSYIQPYDFRNTGTYFRTYIRQQGDSNYLSTGTVSYPANYYIVVTFDDTRTNNVEWFKDGASWGSGDTGDTGGLDAGGDGPTVIGSGYGSYYWDSLIDEVRISNVVRSDAWIKATWESNEDDMLDFDIEETPVTIDITAPDDIADWNLTPQGTQPLEQTGTLSVTCTGSSWTVTATDEDTTNTNGQMTKYDGSSYDTGTKLANAMDVKADDGTNATGSEVTLPDGGTILTGTGAVTGESYTVHFKQTVEWADDVVVKTNGYPVYRIVVTFTGSTP